MKGVPSLSPLPLEGERARVRGNLISFPLPLISIGPPKTGGISK